MAVDGNGSGAGPSCFRATPTVKRRATRPKQSVNHCQPVFAHSNLSIQPACTLGGFFHSFPVMSKFQALHYWRTWLLVA